MRMRLRQVKKLYRDHAPGADQRWNVRPYRTRKRATLKARRHLDRVRRILGLPPKCHPVPWRTSHPACAEVWVGYPR